jgi:DNA-binding NtrC family response regulator
MKKKIGSKKTMLIIEDDKDHRELLDTIFEKKNFNTRLAHSITSALKLLNSTKFDVVLLDLLLPDGNGMDLLEKIVWEYYYRVIIITAIDDVKLAVEAIKRGAYDYFTKPIDFPGLIATVNEIVKIIESGREFNNKSEIPFIRKKKFFLFTCPKITLKELEKRYILSILNETNFKIPEAIKILRIGKTTLYRKIKEYQLKLIHELSLKKPKSDLF